MEDRSLKALEFPDLLSHLKSFSTSTMGRARCEALRPLSDLSLIESRLSDVLEIKAVMETVGSLPLRGMEDVGGVLAKLDVEGAVLTPQELLALAGQIGVAGGLKRFLQKVEASRTIEAPRLHRTVEALSAPRDLERAVLRSIGAKGEILDTASPGLAEIRHRLAAIRERVKAVLERLLHHDTLHSAFQDLYITVRNGRYVVPVRSDSRHAVQGIVHDQSQTRMTLFVEPTQVLSLNNEVSILAAEEREEEFRILTDLSGRARDEIENLRSDFEILAGLDLLHAMAAFSVQLKAVRPVFNREGRIDLRQARHPLLAVQMEGGVVPVDLKLGEAVKVLIVSGANAGGKTVALKTLGLLTLMAQSGLPVPAAVGSEFAVFEDVFSVIGDEQNLEASLSTFSSHLLHLNQILERAGTRSLVLLDELGVGTHAAEGCALAMGFLDRLREKGSTVMVTTHFDRLKVYGFLHPDVMNAAVEFDDRTLEPKFSLIYGKTGTSNAFPVAEKMGLAREVLDRARHYLDGGKEEMIRALEALEQARSGVEQERHRLEQVRGEAEAERQRLKGLAEDLRKRRQDILAGAEAKAGRAVAALEQELKAWIQRKRDEPGAVPASSQRAFRKEAQEVREKLFRPPKRREDRSAPVDLKTGERVRVESLRRDGVVARIEEARGQVDVATEWGTVKTVLADVVRLDGTKSVEGSGAGRPPDPAKAPSGISLETATRLNVIGLTVDEALPEVDRFLDQALLRGVEKVEIIHGIGSGRLRDGIGRFLREHRAVRVWAPGQGRGGAGITVVELA